MRLAEQGREGHVEDLFAGIIADVQDPGAPIFIAGRHNERPHHEGGMVTRLGQVAYGGTVSIDQYLFSVGAMKIELNHVPPPMQTKGRLYR